MTANRPASDAASTLRYRLEPTETEFCLMIDRTTYSGAAQTEKRTLGAMREKDVLAHAKQVLDTEPGVFRVEVFSREVPTAWEKVEELRHEGPSDHAD